MPHSLREQLLQVVVTRLTTAIAPVPVHRSPTVALTREQAPALLLFPDSDEVIDRPNDRVERQLTLRVLALVRGTETEADALLVATHSALMADTTLAGLALDLTELDSEWELEDADNGAASIATRYAIRYRTLKHDLTQRG